MIYQEEPEQFNPRFEIASCFIEYNGEFLLLHRQDHKPEGNTWGVPAGKVEEGEKPLDSICREIQQETGYQIPKSEISYFGKVYVRYPTYDFIYHMFHTRLTKRNGVEINLEEHKSHGWFSPEKALELPLIMDLDACIRLFYEIE